MYSRTLKEIPTYDLPKTASPLERISPAMNVFFSVSFAFFSFFCLPNRLKFRIRVRKTC
jgi:hypothetical protein